MVDPLFLTRMLGASLMALILVLCAVNGTGDRAVPADRAPMRVVVGR